MNPTFGDKVEGAHYQTRYGVYAVIPNQEKTKIILVQAPNGAWFLPGGEIEAGEDHYSALERELIEELGFTATLGQYYGQADEYFYSSHRDTYYYNPAYIYEVVDFQKLANLSKISITWPGFQLTKPLLNLNVAVINGESNNGKKLTQQLTNPRRKL